MIIIECVCVRWHVQQVACCCYLKCRIERGQLAQPWCVCVCVCVCAWIISFRHAHTHINTHTQTHTHAYKYIHTQTHTHTHIQTLVHTLAYEHIYKHIQTHIHTWDQSSGALFVVKCKEMRKIRHDSSNHFYSYTA